MKELTGYRDKKGIEIKEGDICKYDDITHKPVIKEYPLGEYGAAHMSWYPLSWFNNDVTIIGSIYKE